MKTLLSLTVLVSLVLGQFGAPFASPSVQEVDATPTATQEITETPVVEATASPEGTETPFPEPTVTSEETPTSSTETATPAPTSTTSTEIPASPVAVESPVLSLSTNPDFITPGGKLMLSWKIEGLSSLEKDSLVLQITIPEGFTPQDRVDGKFDETSRLLTISVNGLEGQVQLQTQETVSDTVFYAVLMQGVETLATTELSVPVQGQFTVNRSGGVIQALDGKVKVTFPDGALPEDAIIRAGFPAADSLPEDYYSQHAFELKAFGKAQNTKIERFSRKLTVEVDYSDLDLTEEQEGQLYLYWYNPETGDWHALESYPDPETKTLRALTDHFTVFDIGVNDWRAERLPTTESFQVSKFTGAGTFSLPIEVPPGPGGFQPNVTLSYNSQVVDQATTKAQASWVGMGWSLDGGGGSITENGDNDGYMLTVNGISTQLIQEVDDGRYHTMEENFWKITRDSTTDTWTIYDTQGNIYIFSKKAVYAYYENGSYHNKAYAWYLSTVTNTSGQEITYTYYFQTNYNVGGERTDSAVYVDAITYADERTRIRFGRELREDYPSSYDTDAAVHLYQKKRLSNITVERDGDGNGSFETKIRNYEFTYIGETEDASTADRIWPKGSYSAGSKALTLRSVQEWGGWNGTEWANSLPPYTFTYDNLHLTSATNGYGGKVTFTYEDQPWYSTDTTDYIFNSSSCTGWTVHNGSAVCNTGTGEMTVTDGAVSKPYVDTSTRLAVRPGGVYEVTFTGSKTSGSVVNVGIMYRLTSAYKQLNPNNGFSYIVNPLSKNAETVRPFFKTTGTGKFTNVKVRPLRSFYRVTQKTVSDGNNHNYVTQYDYEDPLVASADHEFRGHGIVTETTPDGTITKTYYYQGDATKGRIKEIEVYAPDGETLRSETISVHMQTDLPEYPVKSKYRHAWVRLDSQTTYIYDASGAQVGGTKTVFTYEETYGNLIEKKEYDNPEGNGAPYRISTTTYTTPKNNSTTYIVSAPARQQVLDESGNILADTLYFYNNSTTNGEMPSANVLTMTRTLVNDGQYTQVDYEYDDWGNQISVTTYTGYGTTTIAPTTTAQTTTTCYEQFDPVTDSCTLIANGYHTYPMGITNAKGHKTSFTYNYKFGLPETQTDPNGNTTSAEYDVFGRVTKLIRPGDDANNPTILFAYAPPVLEADGSINTPYTTTLTQRIQDSQIYSVSRQYDGMGREIKLTSGGIITDTIYESPTVTKQRVPYETGTPLELFTTTTSDLLTLSVTVTAPDDTSTVSLSNGLVTTITDARGNSTTSTSDVWGRTISVTPPTGPEVTYTYDSLGNLLTASRGGATTTLTYDNAGRKTSMTDPDMGTWTYTYDALGNLKTQTDARGCVLTLGYDSLSRPASKNSSGTGCGTQVDTLYTYDIGANGIGRRTETKNTLDNIVSTWTYDKRGQVTSETVMGYTTSFAYNNAGMPTSMTYPDGETVAYDYNDRMMLESLTGTLGSVTTSYATLMDYDSAGRMIERTLGNGLIQSFDYYNWDEKVNDVGQGGRLQNLTTGSLQNINYIYDPNGNIFQITDSIANETNNYGYDALDRLTNSTLNSAPENYGYDSTTGNLTSKAGVSLQYNDAAHKHAVSSAGSNTYSYDANGNQITRVIASGPEAGTYNLKYDAENRLVEVKKNGGLIAQFFYDGDGKRVKSVMSGVTTLFVGAHYEVTGSEVTKYYFAGSSRIAIRKDGTLTFLLGDHLGSTSLATDATGTLLVETRYKPWGEVRYTTENSTLPTRYTYTGQYSYMDDPATDLGGAGFGLMFYNARWYDPALGRFAQADTIIPEQLQGTQAWDRFAYTNNNPMRYNDPSGHCIGGSGFWNAVNCVASVIGSTISYIANNPNKVLLKGKSFVVPVVIPKGFGNETMDIINTTVSFKTIRVAGRLGDDIVPATAVIGGIVTVAPEQIEDFQNGAPFSEHLADFAVDGAGFVISEIAGDLVGGLTSPLPYVSIPAMILSDAIVGNIYDNYTDDERAILQKLLETTYDATQIQPELPPGIVPIPAPIAPSPIIPSSTPKPY